MIRCPTVRCFLLAAARKVYEDLLCHAAHLDASDDNPGTKERPFKTINKAAQVLMPGERVLIGEGVYKEFVRPLRGGQAPMP